MYGFAVYTHNVVSENNRCVSGVVALQSNLSYKSKPHKNVSDNRAVVQFAECPYTCMTYNVLVMCVCMHKWVIGKKLLHVWSHNTSRILHPALTQKIDISESRSVI